MIGSELKKIALPLLKRLTSLIWNPLLILSSGQEDREWTKKRGSPLI